MIFPQLYYGIKQDLEDERYTLVGFGVCVFLFTLPVLVVVEALGLLFALVGWSLATIFGVNKRV